ncbi:single-stranded DNA-binding protein [Staphylococcus nepalensis]|jgi:single-strand DNA-binding protein|uniref:Single-stranded DNA-binding protein n=1 Tax=Staphylococcus nepalensis TaxID=214473 RepID=A0A291JIA4_9STAP|nr:MULTISPECIES: single-stranded DNA-binding protein [Staphylococcus]ATH59614.1 single-stranded DNA-binding protein [Staphylococcus nepalensis]ATH64705.1 single-stranded DNA-binding protein [Staphylococcus nepalensis]AWI44062.1 single-stranded DNA-binding protein [Staphylococcus nepalensis]MBO1212975.1 single-stranded DNA-binding protein [Staphylococcus nepalensis]MBO1217262.1 single-stranded DNA-binding protein [Staphylococcus nepalensis]
MINSIVIVGRLTKDPKIYEKEGNKRATFCVAVSRNYKDKNQNIVCDYLFCKAFGKMANNVEKYISQGSLVGITGQMQSRKFEKEGQMHFVSELFIETIQFMSPRIKKEAEAFFEPPTIETNEPSISEFHLEENDIYEIV